MIGNHDCWLNLDYYKEDKKAAENTYRATTSQEISAWK